jgi:hypothetical protein
MRFAFALAVTLALLDASLLAAQQLPPIRPLGPVTHVSPKGVLGAVSLARPLSNGGVIVNDIKRRQLVLFDSSLTRVKVVADTSPTSANRYTTAMAGLLPYRGDSSLFIDMQALAALVMDANGEVARVMALPSNRDAYAMVGGPFGSPGFDPEGRLVFRGSITRGQIVGRTPSGVTPPSAQFVDSAPVIRVDRSSGSRETLAYITIPKQSTSFTQDNAGKRTGATILVNPFPVVDDWALMPDGRVAIVRGADFHVEWLDLDGRWASTAKVPYTWERLDDDAKRRVRDSVSAGFDVEREKAKKALEADPKANLPGVMRTVTSTLVDGSWITKEQTLIATTSVVDIKYLADYRPAFRMGAVRADAEGNLWVRTTEPTDRGAVYYVINGKGQLIDRVKLPYGRVIAGFAAGIVYMGVEDDAGVRLERARIR